MELNATHDSRTLDPIAVGQEVLIVIGEHLQEAVVEDTYREKELVEDIEAIHSKAEKRKEK